MKISKLSETPPEPVSHDPALEKQVLLRDVGTLRALSHIVLPAGSRVSTHSHRDMYEIFYIIRGSILFVVDNRAVELEAGTVLVVEPGETHSIEEVRKECEMLYVHV